MKSTQAYKKVAREGFKLPLSDEKLDSLYTKSQNAIEAFKEKNPKAWEMAEEVRINAEYINTAR